MPKKNLSAIGLSLLTALVCVLWCSQQYPATSPVTGILTVDGVPYPDVVITYASVTGNPSAIGKTDAEGKYTLTTFKPKDGAMPGECVVLLIPDDLKIGEGSQSLKELAIAQKSKIHFRYFEKATSDLTVQVDPGQNNHTLEIKSE